MKKVKCYDISHRSDVFRECKGSPTLTARMGTGGNNVPLVLSQGQGGDVSVSSRLVPTLKTCSNASSRSMPLVLSENGTDRAVCVDKTPPLKTTTVPCFALAENTIGRKPQNGGNATGVHGVCVPINTMIAQGRPSYNGRLGSGIGKDGQPQNTLSATHCHAVCFDGCVRRLTPIECERLQGFPDNYTQIPYRGKSAENCPDAPRYKALGNSWAVPVVRWIGKRIDQALKSQGETK